MAAPVQIRGAREVRAALRKIDTDAPKGFRAEFLPIARSVQQGIQRKVPVRSGDARDSVRARASQTGAAVAFGGGKAPYFPWLDFGGTTGKGHRPGAAYSGSVKRPWMGRPGDGRYVYPTITEQLDDIEKAAADAVINVAKRNDLEVR